jgi:hypothetical protein
VPTPSNEIPLVQWSDVAAVIRSHYREELCQSVKAALAVVASLSLKKRDHCLVLVFVGGSGRGKSIIVRVILPDGPRTEKFLERVDDFTPASFVSHASNRTPDELAAIDLLPRIQNKVMLTKELAPLFRNDERELRQNFGRLTSVLDGVGYVTNSGTHGARGYTGRYMFNWIGATTPIPERTHEIMAQLGNRLLFYEVAGEDASEEELLEFARSYGASNAVEECQKTVNDFIEGHFKSHPVESLDPDSIGIENELLREIVRYAQLIANGRVEVTVNASSDMEAATPEGPHRVILLLQTLARGLALVENRSSVTAEDLDVIRHIAFSSIPLNRRELLQALLGAGGCLTSSQAATALNLSKPTALTRMKELAATGICGYEPGDPSESRPAEITLPGDWRWLIEGAAPPGGPALNDVGVRASAADSPVLVETHS